MPRILDDARRSRLWIAHAQRVSDITRHGHRWCRYYGARRCATTADISDMNNDCSRHARYLTVYKVFSMISTSGDAFRYWGILARYAFIHKMRARFGSERISLRNRRNNIELSTMSFRFSRHSLKNLSFHWNTAVSTQRLMTYAARSHHTSRTNAWLSPDASYCCIIATKASRAE